MSYDWSHLLSIDAVRKMAALIIFFILERGRYRHTDSSDFLSGIITQINSAFFNHLTTIRHFSKLFHIQQLLSPVSTFTEDNKLAAPLIVDWNICLLFCTDMTRRKRSTKNALIYLHGNAVVYKSTRRMNRNSSVELERTREVTSNLKR